MKRYALFLHSQSPPDPEALRAALSGVGGLTAHDASKAAARTSGVLLRDLSREQARSLSRALLEHGVIAELVDAAWLTVPPPITCRRAVPSATSLTVYDPHGRATAIEWSRVKALSGGVVPVGSAVKVKDMQIHHGTDGTEFEDAEYAYKERDQLTVDIVVDAPVCRYRIDSERFDYSYLGQRKRPSSGRNTALLAADLAAHLHDAAIGKGIEQLIADPRKTHRYRNEQALNHDVAWLLWRHFGPGAALSGALEYRRQPFAAEPQRTTLPERARAAAASRVIYDNQEGLRHHMTEYRKVDLALSALAGVVAAIWLTNKFAYDSVGGEWVFAPIRGTLLAALAFAGAAWLAYALLRSRRRRSYWIGG